MSLRNLKCDHVYKELQLAIAGGNYVSGEKLPSGKELAAQYSISHLTMRKVLHQLEQDGFISQIQGRGTFVRKIQTVHEALVLLDYAQDIHALFPRPIQNVLQEAGYVTTIFDTDRTVENSLLLREVLKSRCELLLFDVGHHFPWEALADLPAGIRKINFHRAGFTPAPFPCSTVLCDHAASGRIGMEALLQSGCRRVAIMAGLIDYDSPVNKLYLDGALEALRKYSLEPVFIYHHDDLTEQELDAFFEKCDGCLAILDSLLVQVCRAAEKHSLCIPEQYRLVGRNNTPWAESYHLTSIDLRPQALAARILALLQAEKQEEIHVTIEPKVVWRKSCPEPTVPAVHSSIQ
ncbi:GntR family transcriptional regulator [Victivallis vadensis]|jgi:uncharacterized HTH-type transcriptional regulator ybgA|uniref:GntR family transcriptional regulator n=1 Tax=Victivallis vadensis TaxID=172901 RepID=UPI003AF5B9B7